MASYIKGGMKAKGIWKQYLEVNIWGVEKAPQWGTSWFVLLPNIVRVIKSKRLRWASHKAKMEEVRSTFKILTGKHTWKRPLGRSGLRWEDNRMDLKEIGTNMRNWVDSAQDSDHLGALVKNMALNLWVS